MSGKGRQREDIKQEDILQAVVIADSFNVRFAPITEKKPRTLLPVVNVPMLDYTLEFLAAAGVQEIFVFCCHLADQIRTHIRNSKWNESSSPCTVTPILSEGCLSMGDAMREIDDKSLIRSDFILVYGDIVSNLDLKTVVQEHKKRREKDKNAVMTVITKAGPPGHCSRCREDDLLLAIDSTNNRILHFMKTGNQKKFEIPSEVLTDHKNVQIRYDLLDCQISVCSPQVPALFKDNFDYLGRDDFIRGILMNEEIMGNTIFTKIVRDEYAARISNLQMYDIISRDIMDRWAYPLVPDNNISSNHDNKVSYGRHNVYLSKDVTLARGCVLEEKVVVGSGSCIGSDTTISQSVIGNNCKIGENVRITGSYIWDNVVIENDCVIDTSVICSNVTVYNGVTVTRGSVIGWDVKVGPQVELPPGCMLQSHPMDDDDGFDLPEADQGQLITESSPDYGSKSLAYEYKAPYDSDDEDNEELVQDIWGLTIQSDDDVSSVGSHKSDDFSDEDEEMQDETTMFYNEMIDQLRRSEEENISNENMILEINSLKHAYNIAIRDLHGMVLKSLIDVPLRNSNGTDSQLMVEVKKHLTKHAPLLKNYIKPETAEPQMDGLTALEEFCLHEPRVSAILVKILHLLYDMDVLEEQVLFRWYKTVPNTEDIQERKQLRKQIEPLIKWLQEAEEESSEED